MPKARCNVSSGGKILTRSKAIHKNWYVAEKVEKKGNAKAAKKAPRKVSAYLFHDKENKEP